MFSFISAPKFGEDGIEILLSSYFILRLTMTIMKVHKSNAVYIQEPMTNWEHIMLLSNSDMHHEVENSSVFCYINEQVDKE